MGVYILQKDIVIEAGTIFENLSTKAQEQKAYDFVIGFHKDAAGFARIGESLMEEALKHDPDLFIEKTK